jgi:large subunit ribosomal protein L23
VFTEKSGRLQSMGQYVFEVASGANKREVANAVRDLYGVQPATVHILNRKGKSVRFGRTMGRERDAKKAVITLKAGETLTVIEGA